MTGQLTSTYTLFYDICIEKCCGNGSQTDQNKLFTLVRPVLCDHESAFTEIAPFLFSSEKRSKNMVLCFRHDPYFLFLTC